MTVISLYEAQQDLENIIRRVIDNVEPTIVRSESGQQIVMISLDEFNAWQETLYLLSTPANAQHLRRSIAQAKAGKIVERELIEA